jgi:hypothetical protein
MKMVGPFLLALLVGSGAAILDLVSSKFSTTMSLVLVRSRAIYLLGLIHGVLAGSVSALHPGVISFQLANGQALHSAWIWAVLTGIFTRPFLQTKIFTVSSGRNATRIGLQSIMQLFEPQLIREVILDEFYAVRSFVQKYTKRYADLDVVKSMVAESLPGELPEPERQAFLFELEKAKTVTDALEGFLRFVGISAFQSTFPLETSATALAHI